MRHIYLAGVLSLALSACGGGGGDPATLPAPLAAYIGTWATSCAFHAIDTATITRAPGTSDAISIMSRTDYYSNADCTGTILGTFTQGASATAVYAGTVDAPVVFTEGAAAVVVQVDKVTTSFPPRTWTVTGPGVVYTAVDGYAQWCIAYANGDGSCVADPGPLPAGQNYTPTHLVRRGNTLYALSPVASALAGKAYQRQ
jgi:hypothetical protein